jgi:hypothetical protein
VTFELAQINISRLLAPLDSPPVRPAGVAEAEERLTHLRAHGPSAHVFTLKDEFVAEGNV